jgi:F-type H+-transporting ATPase subunit epsilon
MAGQLTLRIITPERVALDTTADSVRIPGLDGDIGILPKHAPMVAALDIGVLRFTSGGGQVTQFVGGGFAEVKDNTVRVVTSAGEAPEEIDEERARAAEQRARERISVAHTSADPIDLIRAQAALRRAIMRLRTRSGR